MNILPLSAWLTGFTPPLLMAGPCSAESEEQVLATAQALKDLKRVSFFRAGIWKPRTNPGHFEGVGTKGLVWLQRVKNELGMKCVVEVASAKHVEDCLKHEIDAVWIGARTTVSPFSVQEIADSLEGVDIPVFVKNPVSPDLHLWIGALERLNRAGLQKLVAIHRGFSTPDQGPYRNSPHWEFPVELKRRIPNLPIVCDPSHICGTRDFIWEISQHAMDLDMSGLIIETHLNPDKALSDAKQQITPEQLKEILQKLKIRTAQKNSSVDPLLDDLRRSIDQLDHNLLELLSKRFKVSQKIGQYKKEKNLTALQMNRWETVLKDRMGFAEKLGLDPEFAKAIFDTIHAESLKGQTEIMSH